MAHDEYLLQFDHDLFEELVRAFRAAEAAGRPSDHNDSADGRLVLDPSHPAIDRLRAVVAQAKTPSAPTLRRLGKELAVLEKFADPESITVDSVRVRIAPAARMKERLDRGQVPFFDQLGAAATRNRLELHEPFWHLRWVVDAEYRLFDSTSDEWPFVTSRGKSTRRIDDALLGSSPIEVDGVFVQPFAIESRGAGWPRWHRPEMLATVGEVLDEAAGVAPPPLEEFRVWYKQLHARYFTTGGTYVPNDAEFPRSYERFLAKVNVFLGRLRRFYERARRSRRASSVLVYLE